MELNEKYIDGFTDEEKDFLTSRQETKWWEDIIGFGIKAYRAEIEAIKEINPNFRGKTLKQLNDDEEFQQALKEYRAKYPLPDNAQNEKIVKNIATALNSNKVSDYVIPNTKVANLLPSGKLIPDEITDVVVKGQTSRTKEVTTKVVLSYDNDNVTLRGRHKITAYDRVVHNAIISIKKADNKHFTPAMVYRTMNGLTDNEKASPVAIEKITESVNKLLATRASIDFTDEAKMYRKNISSATLEGSLIEARKIELKAGKETVIGYEFISEKDPIIYEHAKVSGQIYTIDVNLLQTKYKVRGTEEVIIIREYLIRQIEWIKSEKVTRSENITYQGIYEELGISPTNLDEKEYREKTFKIRNHVKAILETWTEQNYIKDYAEYKEGKQVKGIKIQI
jgi:hypothetical protein